VSRASSPPSSLSPLLTRADVPGVGELELELILSQMAQKPMLRGEVGESALSALQILRVPPKMHRFSTYSRMPYAFQLECVIS